MTNYDKQNRRFAKLHSQLQEALVAQKNAEERGAKLYGILDGIMHETRRLNSEIASACEEISKNIGRHDYAQASQDADDVFYTSGLISSRLTFADFELNPESLTRQPKYSAGVYKKFDKARRILYRSAARKRITIRLNGPSRNEIDVLPAFEMVPFVLLDNAVKYSPDSQDITVSVTDSPFKGCRVLVQICSIGPVVSRDELTRLQERGFRGSSAQRSSTPGEGIGLYLASTLIKLANGEMRIMASDHPDYSVNGVGYSKFTVELQFR